MFNPSLPADGTKATAAEMRGQLNGLKDLIDAGVPGPPGPVGADGPPGSDGSDGAPGPPFASAVVDAVNTLEPDVPATVSADFDGTNVRFTFGIPRGMDGATGEVSNDDLAAAIAGTSASTNGVATLDIPFTTDPPTLADMELVREKINELITALRR